jgi:hypothetical protein
VGWSLTRSLRWGANGGSASEVRPLARSRDLIIEEVEDEVLIYDEQNDRAHCLSAEAARVWRACDGQTAIDALTVEADLDAETTRRALAELQSLGLLEAGPSGVGLTRRDLTFRAAKVSAAAAAAPLIVSINPSVAGAQVTPTPAVCMTYNGQSCSACNEVIGCCCCCQEGPCKTCFPVSTCPMFTCPDKMLGHCATTGDLCAPGTIIPPGHPNAGKPCECEFLIQKGQEGTCGCVPK